MSLLLIPVLKEENILKTQLKLPAFNPIDEKVENFFNGKLPLIVIDATGNQKAMNNDVNLIRHGGRIVFVGYLKAISPFTILISIKKKPLF